MLVEHGLKENWKQFSLLVIINSFVGGMVGLERTILPEIAEIDFGVAAKTAILSFIVVFGIAKAFSNYYTGLLANHVGRKNLLVIGWLFAIPVPLLLIFSSHWYGIIAANIFLGINQGFTWSSTVVMKIDLVGEKNRGLAMGINESAGYLAVGLVAWLSGWLAVEYGLRPYPFYMGILLVFGGLTLSYFLVNDTIHHVRKESTLNPIPKLENVFHSTSWSHPELSSITQAGLVNNLNDGMIWGLFPILLSAKGYSLKEVGIIVSIYPFVWGLCQLITGKLSDHLPKKQMLFWGMLVQGLVIFGFLYSDSFLGMIILSVLLGLGTATVYPTFLASIADYTHPDQRAKSIGVFRLWRDLGYALGALITGIIADLINTYAAISAVGGITVLSSLVIMVRMRKPSF